MIPPATTWFYLGPHLALWNTKDCSRSPITTWWCNQWPQIATWIHLILSKDTWNYLKLLDWQGNPTWFNWESPRTTWWYLWKPGATLNQPGVPWTTGTHFRLYNLELFWTAYCHLGPPGASLDHVGPLIYMGPFENIAKTGFGTGIATDIRIHGRNGTGVERTPSLHVIRCLWENWFHVPFSLAFLAVCLLCPFFLLDESQSTKIADLAAWSRFFFV